MMKPQPRKLHADILLFALLILFPTLHSSASTVRVKKTDHGWTLLVDGRPYVVKGMCYTPAKVGEMFDDSSIRDWTVVDDNKNGRNDYAYDSYVDKNGNNRRDSNEPVVGDFQLLKDMGCNTIRVYHHASLNPQIQALYKDAPNSQDFYNHDPHKELYRDLFDKYGIRVAMGDLLGSYTIATGANWQEGTDYENPEQLRRMMLSVEDMVREFKDEPYILLWIIANENTNTQGTHTKAAQQPEAFGKFANQVARRIHELDPNHPVCLCDYDDGPLSKYSSFIPDVDIIGMNSYRFMGFGSLWKLLNRTFHKPVLITEYGISVPKIKDGQLDENFHAEIYGRGWQDIAAHTAGGTLEPSISLGGFVFEWLDNWWQDGNPWEHYLGTTWNHEICGVASQGDGKDSPYLRQLRKTYFTLQKLWTEKSSTYP